MGGGRDALLGISVCYFSLLFQTVGFRQTDSKIFPKTHIERALDLAALLWRLVWRRRGRTARRWYVRLPAHVGCVDSGRRPPRCCVEAVLRV